MSISSVDANAYQNTPKSISSAKVPTISSISTVTSQTEANTGGIVNNSSLSIAVSQALAQLNGGVLMTPASTQSSSDFTNTLLASLQGSPTSNASSKKYLSGLYGSSTVQTAMPVKLDTSSVTIKLQTSIQNLIAQLDGNSNNLLVGGSAANTPSGMANLQQTFNKIVTASGGNPSQITLQAFLKTVAVNIQGSMSIGNMFDASA